jgi:hypothetical protein
LNGLSESPAAFGPDLFAAYPNNVRNDIRMQEREL